MKILIVDDEPTNRLVLHRILKSYGECDVAANGVKAVAAFDVAIESGRGYDLICLDIMMPEMDGQEALKIMRSHELSKGIEYPDGARVIMTTAVDDSKQILSAFKSGCEAYVIKPIQKADLIFEMEKLGLIQPHPEIAVGIASEE